MSTERSTIAHGYWPDFKSWLTSDSVKSVLYWLPSVILVAGILYGSILWNVIISLTDSQGFAPPSYANLDLEQYRLLLSDPQFIEAFRNTLVLLVVFTGLALGIGLLLAILVDQIIRFQRGFRMAYLYPFSLSFVVTAQVWLWQYNFNEGLINEVIRALGLPAPHWIGNPQFVLTAIIFALIWQFSGFTMIVYLAGLQSIPTDQYKAAKIDGASLYKTYRRIIIPQLRSSTVSAAVILMVFSLKAFNFLYSFFGSYQPAKGADILATKMMREAFQELQWAYGAAIAVVMFLLAIVAVSPYLYSQYRHGEL